MSSPYRYYSLLSCASYLACRFCKHNKKGNANLYLKPYTKITNKRLERCSAGRRGKMIK